MKWWTEWFGTFIRADTKEEDALLRTLAEGLTKETQVESYEGGFCTLHEADKQPEPECTMLEPSGFVMLQINR